MNAKLRNMFEVTVSSFNLEKRRLHIKCLKRLVSRHGFKEEAFVFYFVVIIITTTIRVRGRVQEVERGPGRERES